MQADLDLFRESPVLVGSWVGEVMHTLIGISGNVRTLGGCLQVISGEYGYQFCMCFVF